MNAIYLDNNASTPMLPEVLEAMRPYQCERFGNPASSHRFGRQARQALEDARERIAALLDAHPDEVVFTSGATEANNLAIFGLTGPAPAPIVTSFIEHPSVLAPIRQLLERGYPVTYLPLTPSGVINLDHASIDDEPGLVAVMLANQETGAVQPIETLVRTLNKSGRAAFHCDAAAAAGKMPISFRALGVTTLTLGAHKFHGPKGIGALVVRKGAKLHPLFFGGHQQHANRPGTEPVALAVGMAAALEWSLRNLDAHCAHLLDLRRRFLAYLRDHAAPVVLNGPDDGGLPGTLNLSFPGCKADALLMNLDLAGVACSTGSACSSGSLLPSPVLQAMHKAADVLHSAMRFSLSPLLTAEDIDAAARRIAQCVNKLRQTEDVDFSPKE
ncbi:MAG: cysteine desulfurase [Planctomycetes bacterium]|nr:cysteine desulfurase [Planctomycetota bacterium]